MQAMLTNHFMFGGYYPVGGSSEIAFNIIPTIEAAGGRVLVRAPVSNILMDEYEGRVVGVSVKHAKNVYDITAPMIISDAGIMNTFNKLLSPSVIRHYSIQKNLLSHARNGLGLMSVFIGLDGTKEELGLKASNIWLFKVLCVCARASDCVCVCVCVYVQVSVWVVAVWCSGCVLGSGPEVPDFKPYSGQFSIWFSIGFLPAPPVQPALIGYLVFAGVQIQGLAWLTVPA